MNFDSRRGVVHLKRGIYVQVNEHWKMCHNKVLDQKTYLMDYFRHRVADAVSLQATQVYLMHVNMLLQMP